MSFTHDIEKKPQIIGHLAWVKTVKAGYRYMVLDLHREFPHCISWADHSSVGTLFKDTAQPREYMDRLLALPKRRFMGMIFPAIELAIAFDMDSFAGKFRVSFGTSPVYFELLPENGRVITLETQVDSDVQV